MADMSDPTVPVLGWHLSMYEKALADRDRVIARLLDGWTLHPPFTDAGVTSEWHWVRVVDETADFPQIKPEPMSDGEAAIIRQHQEATT